MQTMISRVFTAKGQRETIANAYNKLHDLIPADKYKRQKAAGSLGGASRHGFIELVNNEWVCTR